jgi:N utilization substance protein B
MAPEGNSLPDNTRSSGKRSRHAQRERVVEFLYMWENQRDTDVKELQEWFFEEKKILPADNEWAIRYIEAITARCRQLDEQVAAKAENWSFQRIAKVDLAILRLAIYELLFQTDIPPVVAINEAIELSKRYSTPEAKRFINGILDKIVKEKWGAR